MRFWIWQGCALFWSYTMPHSIYINMYGCYSNLQDVSHDRFDIFCPLVFPITLRSRESVLLASIFLSISITSFFDCYSAFFIQALLVCLEICWPNICNSEKLLPMREGLFDYANPAQICRGYHSGICLQGATDDSIAVNGLECGQFVTAFLQLFIRNLHLYGA
jgi:hypothetical protein